jgi:RNA ligase
MNYDRPSKYPRTYHLPWSETLSSDDKILQGCGFFYDQEVVVTVKMDGENTNMYRDMIHARSVNSVAHPSRDWVKNLHSKVKHLIPYGYKICGENLYAKHSIHYKDLDSYFMVFAVWNHIGQCLSWEETEEWSKKLGLITVPVLYKGKFDMDKIQGLYKKQYQGNEMEGYVVRLARQFDYSDHRYSVAKFVRKDHVKTSSHWLHTMLEKNELKKIVVKH